MDARVGQYTKEKVEWPAKTILGKDVDRSGIALSTRGLRGNQGYFVVVDFQADKAAVSAAVLEIETMLGVPLPVDPDAPVAVEAAPIIEAPVKRLKANEVSE